MSRRPVLAALLLLPLLTSSGCHLLRMVPYLGGEPLPPPAAFKDGSLDFGIVRRILALPLTDESGVGSGTEVVSRTLRDEISRLGRFGVVRPNESDSMLKPHDDPQNSGRIPVATIIELGRRYGVDAVLFGTIRHYRPYTPPSLGMSVTLIDVQTGKIVWSVNDFVDGSDRRCATSMKWFFEDETATGETVFGSEIMHTSPQWFARFATRRVVSTL